MRGLQARSAKHNMARKERFESAGPSPQSAKKRPLHILLLEDDDVDAKLFRLQAGSIRSFTLIVDHVATCAEADERLRSLDYDLCIFDFWLAGESTLPLIEKLGGRAGKMPIMILTGLTIPSIREMGFIAGAASFLGKDHLPRRRSKTPSPRLSRRALWKKRFGRMPPPRSGFPRMSGRSWKRRSSIYSSS